MVLHYPRGVAVVAVFLSALAGFVDAMGFITLGGYFVSFMSGNSTKLAVSLGEGLVGTALTGAGIVVLFVIGVMADPSRAGPPDAVTARRFSPSSRCSSPSPRRPTSWGARPSRSR